MICEKCGQKSASYHYKQSVNNEVREIHLCRDCAEKHGVFTGTAFSGEEMHSKLNALFSGVSPAAAAEVKVCPVCGETSRSIARTGYVGCSACYTTFASMLMPHIVKLHGRAKHSGRTPVSEENPSRAAREKLEALQREQAEAISEENFEKAATLRDKINELKKNIEEGTV